VEVRRRLAVGVAAAAIGDAEGAAAVACNRDSVFVFCDGVHRRDAAEVGARNDPVLGGVHCNVAGIRATSGPIAKEDTDGRRWRRWNKLGARKGVRAFVRGYGDASAAGTVQSGDVRRAAPEIGIRNAAPSASCRVVRDDVGGGSVCVGHVTHGLCVSADNKSGCGHDGKEHMIRDDRLRS
jgi:hypothetical protein